MVSVFFLYSLKTICEWLHCSGCYENSLKWRRRLNLRPISLFPLGKNVFRKGVEACCLWFLSSCLLLNSLQCGLCPQGFTEVVCATFTKDPLHGGKANGQFCPALPSQVFAQFLFCSFLSLVIWLPWLLCWFSFCYYYIIFYWFRLQDLF